MTRCPPADWVAFPACRVSARRQTSYVCATETWPSHSAPPLPSALLPYEVRPPAPQQTRCPFTASRNDARGVLGSVHAVSSKGGVRLTRYAMIGTHGDVRRLNFYFFFSLLHFLSHPNRSAVVREEEGCGNKRRKSDADMPCFLRNEADGAGFAQPWL